MNRYFEAVLVEVKDDPTVRTLCRAPAFYGLEEGDEVFFENGEEVRGTVIASCTMETDSEVTDFVLRMFCGKNISPFALPKITKRVVTMDVKYYPEDEAEDETEEKEETKHE